MKIIEDYILSLKNTLDQLDLGAVESGFSLIEDAYNQEKTVYVIGNGGSASTASHMACDFGKGASVTGKRRLRIISLTDNVAHISAIANDFEYERVFLEQLKNLLCEGDLLIAISASGNSPNLINCFDYAREVGANSIGLVGFSGGEVAEKSTVSIHAVVDSYGISEDVHLIINHIWTEQLKELVSNGTSAK